MQNLKYHTLNVISILLFSYLLAATVNQVVKYALSPTYSKTAPISHMSRTPGPAKTPETTITPIIEAGIFAPPTGSPETADGAPAAGIEDLTLVGTVTGPINIARAMIQKKGEPIPGLFALYKVNNEVTNDVYGQKLVRIDDKKVYLEVAGGQKVVLELYATPKPVAIPGMEGKPSAGDQSMKQTLSRSELRQKVFNNMDEALRGLRAGPNRVNGVIQGYRLINVRPYSVLYKLGARSGDVVRRVNGQAMDSTQKLYGMWESIKNEPRITVDIERGSKIVTYDFSITD